MSGDDRPTMPPVRLPADAELARDALAAPLFAYAVRLARWAGAGVPVGAGGELLDEQLKSAASELDLGATPEELGAVSDAWNLAVDTGLLDVTEDGTDSADAAPGTPLDEPVGTARPGSELDLLEEGDPGEVLELWRNGLDSVLADAATPSFEDLLGGIEGAVSQDGTVNPDAIDLDSIDWNPEEEAEALDSALGGLYLLTVGDPSVAEGSMVPLPVLAASMVVPDDMDEPTDEVLEAVSEVMMRLDEQFRLLEPTGLVEYRPVDEALTQEAGEDSELPADLDDEDVTKYGMVKLTPLGLHGVRERMREAGIEAPLVGDLAERPAEELLAALPAYTEESAQGEIEAWLAARKPLEAARELLAAARGSDEEGPARRLSCQQALSLAGPEAEPALRGVLDDRELGGLARVWLAERGATDVPQPDEEMVFWLTVDTIAAQLRTVGEPEELQGLVQGLVDQHTGFFDRAWRVDHPATAEVLEAMGRVHPDKSTAKEARKAAFKARSNQA